jgi:hypothetical protein
MLSPQPPDRPSGQNREDIAMSDIDTTTTAREIQMGSGRLAPEHVVTAPAREATSTTRRKLTRRHLLGAAALLSPPAMALQYVLAPPGLPRDAAEGFLEGIAADPTRYQLSIIAFLVAMMTGLAGAVVLAIAGRRSAPWWSGIAGTMLALGVLGGCGFAGLRLVAIELSVDGNVVPGAADMWTRVQEGAPFSTLTPLLVMVILGTLVSAVALVRMRRDVTWLAAPAYVVGLVLTSGEFPAWVSVIGAAVQVAGMLPVVRAALRED